MAPSHKSRRFHALVALCAIALAGCASAQVDRATLGRQISGGDCASAVAYMEGSKNLYGQNGELLFEMDSAMVSLLCGRRAAKHIQKADAIAEKLWTRSVSREGASFLLNDYTRPYYGEDFERVMINLMGALDHAVAGDIESALVEARRLNARLAEINASHDNANVYREDAFGRYLSGMLYEAENPGSLMSLDDAFIDYRKAYDAYTRYAADYGTAVPQVLIEDYLRVAEKTGRKDELRAGVASDAEVDTGVDPKKMARVVMVHLSGNAPEKVQDTIFIDTPERTVKLAFPRLVGLRPGCYESALVTEAEGGSERARSYLVEDIESIAFKDLSDRKGRVVAKGLARAAIKQAAVDALSKQGRTEGQRELFGGIGSILAQITEVADTRSWKTLPARVYLARTFVQPGKYSIKAEYCGRSRHMADALELREAETVFVLLQTVY